MPESTEQGRNPTATATDTSASSLRDLPSHLRLWSIAVVGLAIDLSSKHWAFTALKERRIVIPHLLHFQRSLNPGALFGFGQGMTPIFLAASALALMFVLYLFIHTPRSRWSMHIGLGLILAGALGNFYDRTFVTADAVWAQSGRGWRGWLGSEVVLTGKLVREGPTSWLFGEWPDGGEPRRHIPKSKNLFIRPSTVVRDFIKFDTAWLKGYQLWKWIFNAADAFLVIGVGLLLLNFWRDRRHMKEAPSDGRR